MLTTSVGDVSLVSETLQLLTEVVVIYIFVVSDELKASFDDANNDDSSNVRFFLVSIDQKDPLAGLCCGSYVGGARILPPPPTSHPYTNKKSQIFQKTKTQLLS